MKDKTEIGMSPRQIAKQTGLSSSKVIELLNLNGYECSLNEKVDIRIVRGINRLYPFVKQYDSLTGETIELEKNIDLIENTMYNSNTKLFSSLRTEELQKAIINLQRESMIDPEQITRLEEALRNIKNTEEALELEKQELEKRKKELEKKELELEKGKAKRHTRIAIHTVSQSFRDNKQLSVFSDEKIDRFMETMLSTNERPNSYGVILNQAQSRVFEGILRAFTETNYKGHKEKSIDEAFDGIYRDTQDVAQKLINEDSAPYKYIDKIPVLQLTQAQIITLSGYDLKSQRQGDKQDVIDALQFLATKQFCFYWIRLKTENGKPVLDKRKHYVKEEVMEVGTLLRIKTVRDLDTHRIQYYEISPSAPILDQVDNYFLLIPINWRDEVKQVTGVRPSKYTYEFLIWLRLQYELIRRYNKARGKARPKEFKITMSWEDIAITLCMPVTLYKSNKPRASKTIQDVYNVAIKLGYLLKVENNGVADILYLNESHYPKPGEL